MLSILLAFGIDAGWEGRNAANDRDRFLHSLVGDFETNAQRLDSLEAVHQRGLDASLALLAMSGPDAVAENPAMIGQLLSAVMRHPTFAPVTGTVNALVLGGQLNSIEGDSLKAELASWEQHLRDYSEDEIWGAEDVRVRLLPFLSSRIPVTMGYASNDRFDADYQGLLRSVEFGNHLTVRAHRTGVILDQTGELRARITRMIDLARQELER